MQKLPPSLQKYVLPVGLALCLALLGVGVYSFRNRTAQPPAAVEQAEIPAAQSMDERLEKREAVPWPVAGREVLRGYSGTPVWSETLKQYQTHAGLDLAAEKGEAVFAVLPGSVLRVTSDPLYRFTITLSHEDGLITKYAGLIAGNLVSVGDAVESGQILGACGGCPPAESAMAPHIHFEAYQNGAWCDLLGVE